MKAFSASGLRLNGSGEFYDLWFRVQGLGLGSWSGDSQTRSRSDRKTVQILVPRTHASMRYMKH